MTTFGSVAKRPDGQWRARYRDHDHKEHARHFSLKKDAQQWLKEVSLSMMTGAYVDPARAKITVSQWCDQWLSGYANRDSTIRQAEVHVGHIKRGFAGVRVAAVKPSHVKTWVKTLSETKAPSTVYAIYRRFSQIMAAAQRDGLIARTPCSRDTAPPTAIQRPYVATPAQVWELHAVFPAHLRPAVLLGAFAGLRVAETAGLRVDDVDLENAVIMPTIQFGGLPLKSEMASTPVPIPTSFADYLSEAFVRWPGETAVTNGRGGSTSPWTIERAMRVARTKVAGLPEGFRYHDLRHFYASVLIAANLDVKTVQTRVRHASAMTTLNLYSHLMPDSDNSTRTALDPIFAVADKVRTAAALEAG